MRVFGIVFALLIFSSAAFGQQGTAVTGDGVVGSVTRYAAFTSKHVAARNVDVWVPANYSRSKRYRVIYMHDGQNLFNPKEGYGGMEWGIDETMTRLHAEGAVRDTIVVGIWNSPKRFQEYMPQDAMKLLSAERAAAMNAGEVISDSYLRFIVEELKPFIDRQYRTVAGRSGTFIMGSSMGGLISLYAYIKYPAIFGGAACVSTHFPAADGIAVDYIRQAMPKPDGRRIYFDYGTETLDSTYEPFQMKADAVMLEKGYGPKNWVTRKFDGEEHSERSWRKRAEIPIRFLVGK